MGNWEIAIESNIKDSLGGLDTLSQDISARFKGLNSMVDSLSNQVSEISDSTQYAPVSRVDFARASGWSTSKGWGTKVQLSIPVPNYRCYANIYASAQGYVLSGTVSGQVDQFYSGQSRITIQGAPNSPEVAGTISGPQGSEHWGLAMSHSAQMLRSGGGTILITYDVYNGNDYQANQRDATLGVMTTFTRAI